MLQQRFTCGDIASVVCLKIPKLNQGTFWIIPSSNFPQTPRSELTRSRSLHQRYWSLHSQKFLATMNDKNLQKNKISIKYLRGREYEDSLIVWLGFKKLLLPFLYDSDIIAKRHSNSTRFSNFPKSFLPKNTWNDNNFWKKFKQWIIRYR